jgi:peptidoglycan/xylan/chitin deacetylase (PgdA/CDA1 family)
VSNLLPQLALTALAAISVGSVADAYAAPKTLITIDVESLDDIPLPKQVSTACSDGSDCGVMRIATMLEERGFVGTFFLNVYEYKAWGEPALKDLARALQARGHDVTLHTHPQWTYDPARPYMYQYDLEEQTRIIADGKALLESWLGRPVRSHRAGAYGADENTLTALARNGIFLDSSLFLADDHAKLKALSLPGNVPSSVAGVVEIPVTVYERAERSAMLGALIPPFTSVRKIDVDWFLNDHEALAATDAVIDANVPYLVVFLHSFSLMTGLSADGVPIADPESIGRFGLMLDRFAERGLSVIPFDELATRHDVVTTLATDVLPRVNVDAPTHKYLWHLLQARPIGAASGAVLLLIVGLAAAVLLRGQMQKRSRASLEGLGSHG